jgi:hypothetical protein
MYKQWDSSWTCPCTVVMMRLGTVRNTQTPASPPRWVAWRRARGLDITSPPWHSHPQRHVLESPLFYSYGLAGQGIEARWGEILRTRPDRPWCPPSLLYNGYRVFPEGKAAWAWCWPPTPSSAAIKETVELSLFSPPPGPSWPVLGWPLPLPYIRYITPPILYPNIFYSKWTRCTAWKLCF